MLKCDTNMFNVRSGNVCAIQNISIIHVNCLQRYIKRINLPPHLLKIINKHNLSNLYGYVL